MTVALKTEAFRTQHAELVKIVTQISTDYLAPGKLPAGAAKVRELLNTLGGKVSVHLAMEDNTLYPKLLTHSNDDVKKKAKAFIDEMGNIKKAFMDYNTKWSQSAIEKNSAQFVTETKALFAALGDRINRENNDLYVMVDKLS